MRRFFLFFLYSIAFASPSALAEGPTADSPAADAARSDPPSPAELKLELTVTGFTEANAAAIRARAADLRQRLQGVVGDSGGAPVAVQVELAGGAVLVTVDESFPGQLDGLDLAPGPMGHRMLAFGRAWQTATQANVWLAMGPLRDAAVANNLPLAEALARRVLVVRYRNAAGWQLSFALAPTQSGAATQPDTVWVRTKRGVVEVRLIQNGFVPLPVGADGRPSEAAALYEFFGVKP